MPKNITRTKVLGLVWRDGARKREREKRKKKKKKKRSNFFSDKFASSTAIIILPLFLT